MKKYKNILLTKKQYCGLFAISKVFLTDSKTISNDFKNGTFGGYKIFYSEEDRFYSIVLMDLLESPKNNVFFVGFVKDFKGLDLRKENDIFKSLDEIFTMKKCNKKKRL